MADITITVTIDDTDQKCMKNDLLDLDTWVQDAVTGKKNNCWKRFQREWTTKLMDDETFTDPIPSNKTDISHPNVRIMICLVEASPPMTFTTRILNNIFPRVCPLRLVRVRR